MSSGGTVAGMMQMNPTEERTPREVEIDDAREGWDTTQVEYLAGGVVRAMRALPGPSGSTRPRAPSA